MEIYTNCYYCDKIEDKGSYYMISYKDNLLGLIFKNPNLIIKCGEDVIYE